VNDLPLIICCGYSGAGKTTTARFLADRLGVPILHPEVIRAEMNVKKYTRADTPRVLATQVNRIRALFAAESTAIIDNNLLSAVLRQMFFDLARDEGRPVACVHVTAPLPVMRARIESRACVPGGPPNNPDVLLRQALFWQDPADVDVLLNGGEVTLYELDTNAKTVTRVRGDAPPECPVFTALKDLCALS
jgi:predicted kinase